MSSAPEPTENPPLTPCIGTCRLDSRGYCAGCQRSGEEIGRWRNMSNDERLHVMTHVLPLRKNP